MRLEDFLTMDRSPQDDCIFCKLAAQTVGSADVRGAVKVYEVGTGLRDGWYAMLQDTVVSDPKTGFRILLIPKAHLTSFVQVSSVPPLAHNFGTALVAMSYAMQRVRDEEQGGLFVPAQIVYGKCLTDTNTQKHLHLKLDEPSAGLAQPFPPDAHWIENQDKGVYFLGTGIVEMEVTQVRKSRLSDKRIASLAERLMMYANE